MEEEEEIALLLSPLVDVADVANVDEIVADVGDVDGDDGDNDDDDDSDDDDDDDEDKEEVVDTKEEDVDVEAMPIYLAPRIPPLLTAAPRVFFR